MIKKLILSAVVLTVLISAKESHAAGVGSLARTLATAGHVVVMEAQAMSEDEDGLIVQEVELQDDRQYRDI